MSHERWSEMAAAYALGMQDDDERAAFEAHLADCVACRAEVQSFAETVNAIGGAVPLAEPSPMLRERILAAARKTVPRRAPSTWGWRLAAAACFLLAIGASAAWWNAVRVNYAVQAALDYARTQASRTQSELLARDSLLQALTAPDVRTVSLAATGKAPSARLSWNPRERVVVLTTFDLPRANPGRTYQLWAIEPGHAPVSLGTFNPSRPQESIALKTPENVNIAVAAVTEEPAGGSPQPTSTPFLAGQLVGGGR
jgi:anti-sigma-K factor RskA